MQYSRFDSFGRIRTLSYQHICRQLASPEISKKRLWGDKGSIKMSAVDLLPVEPRTLLLFQGRKYSPDDHLLHLSSLL